jgi:phosphoglycerate dehydrogenase-like enzyme
MEPRALVDPHPRTLELLFDPGDLKRLQALVRMTVWEDGRMPAEMVENTFRKASVIIGQTDLPRERLERATALKAIVNVEGNFQPNVYYEYCFERGIHVLGVGVAFGKAVAEMALGMALALARGIPQADRLFRRGQEVYGRFSNQESFLISGADVGLVGFGNLGRSLLPLLEPFRCRVRVHDPWLPQRWLAEFDDPVLAGRGSGYVQDPVCSGRCDGGEPSDDREEPARPDAQRACLVLVSRASLVDFDALTAKVRKGDIRAAVDVFPQEPFLKRHPLRALDGVVLSAHRAGSLSSAYRLMGEMLVDDVGQILKGLPPLRLQRAERETVARMRSMPVKR